MKKLDIWSDKLVVCTIEPLVAEISRGTVCGKSREFTSSVRLVEA